MLMEAVDQNDVKEVTCLLRYAPMMKSSPALVDEHFGRAVRHDRLELVNQFLSPQLDFHPSADELLCAIEYCAPRSDAEESFRILQAILVSKPVETIDSIQLWNVLEYTPITVLKDLVYYCGIHGQDNVVNALKGRLPLRTTKRHKLS